MTDQPTHKERSPGMKLLLVALIGFVLTIPLMVVYALVWDSWPFGRLIPHLYLPDQQFGTI